MTSPTTINQAFQRGLALHQQGRIAEAEAAYTAVLREQPNHADALHMLGIACLQTDRVEAALRFFDRAIALDPKMASAHHNRGVALETLDQAAEAIPSYNRAIFLQPGYVEAYFNRGNARGSLGLWAEAEESYSQAIALNPDFADAHYNRGNALKTLGRLDDAVASYDRAIALTPESRDAHFNRAETLRAQSRLDEAVIGYDKAIAIDPDCIDAHFHRGAALGALGRMSEAIASLERVVALKPDSAEAFNNLGIAFMGVNRFGALKAFGAAIAIRADYPEAFNNRGNVLRELLRPQDALADYDWAIALKPGYAEAHENRGLVLSELGRLDAATMAIEQSLRIAPDRVRAYYSLAESRRFTSGDPYVAAMQGLARNSLALTSIDQIHLNFALGKALADVGDFEGSFRHLLAGNALKRAQIAYDETAALARLERVRAAFSSDRMRRDPGAAQRSAAPIFIVGMPRSGSTLIEQILASHPDVVGAGEIFDFSQALAEFGDDEAAPLNAPEAAAALSGDQLNQLGASYLRRIDALAPKSKRIVNKTLDNFRFLGLVHLALPGARIIHVRRDPIDTCLSCFSKLFAGHLDYVYDLAELGRYHRAYAGLMAHWRGVIPAQTLLEIRYEDVVEDIEGQARRIVAHCGLPWDAACLEFHRTERPVRTASLVQVRQPLFNSSVGRWRVYAPFLNPLFDGLGYDPAAAP